MYGNVVTKMSSVWNGPDQNGSNRNSSDQNSQAEQPCSWYLVCMHICNIDVNPALNFVHSSISCICIIIRPTTMLFKHKVQSNSYEKTHICISKVWWGKRSDKMSLWSYLPSHKGEKDGFINRKLGSSFIKLLCWKTLHWMKDLLLSEQLKKFSFILKNCRSLICYVCTFQFLIYKLIKTSRLHCPKTIYLSKAQECLLQNLYLINIIMWQSWCSRLPSLIAEFT